MPSSAASGERFDPRVLGGRLVEAEHLARYLVAAQFVGGRDVVDIGCGTGWGTALLAQAPARRCVGVDRDEGAVAQARKAYPDAGEFRVDDAQELSLPTDAFDVAICLETIEHLADPERALDEIRRVLRPSGLLVISSPNPRVYPPGNPHHVREFDPAELEDALGRRFAHVSLLRQQSFLASLVAGSASAGKANRTEAQETDVFKLAAVRDGQQLYTVALASDAAVPKLRPAAVLASAVELRFWHERLARLDAAVARAADLEQQVRELGDRLLEAEQASTRIARLEGENERLRSDLTEFHELVHTQAWRLLQPWRRAMRLAKKVRRVLGSSGGTSP